MEALIVALALVALAILSLRFGWDSRDGIRSREHELARQGMTWDTLDYHQRQLERSADARSAAPDRAAAPPAGSARAAAC
jgi:hypothetical protein